ncbi:MAG: hypothetical protein M5T52_24545 [Ignavibacteriaceae bacterium]|nr:hypothetical protein [Ignavibacteriaceae bacterium]
MEELKRIIKEKRDQLDKHEDEIPQEHYYREGAIDMLDYLESIVSRVELPVKPANGGQIYLLYKDC